MDCKDLMIGDWFKAVDYNSPFRITAIYDDVVQTQADYQSEIDGNWYSEAEIKDLVPIELTEDILEKNGLKKQEANEWFYYKEQDGKGQYMILWSMDYNYLEIGSYTNAYGEFERFGVCYVHQLQHALRLCGIDMEIKL